MINANSALDQYLSLIETNTTIKNETLLLTAYKLVKEEVVQSNYSIKSVRLAHKIYGYLGDNGLNERINLLKKYLLHRESSSPEDKFWANWELVDNLALLKRYEETINEQLTFLEWTKSNMSTEYWIKVMYDSTQAIGWVIENRTNEWFDIYYDLIDSIKPTKQNRHHRVLYVETATGLFAFNLKKYDDALKEIERYNNIILEDTLWSEYKKFSIRRLSYLLEVHNGKNEKEKYDEVVNSAISEIESYIKQYNQGLFTDIDEICDLAHDIGACLMWGKKYQEAMTLFKYAIENQGTGITHFFYAICTWALQKNIKKTLHHLQMAELKVNGNSGLRSRYIHMFLDQPEFADIHDDKEFLSVFKR